MPAKKNRDHAISWHNQKAGFTASDKRLYEKPITNGSFGRAERGTIGAFVQS
ncbi:hypothetical protein [Bifidobacterium sp. UBA6881]|uniref:hypothetical protein n=1 Tax=Bifidobacterium sp. UBA6881 TaxID=1946109 RepID=UPI0025C2F6EA|nr:hypothetical protein [Bifidobacterium sp. UBA6881]